MSYLPVNFRTNDIADDLMFEREINEELMILWYIVKQFSRRNYNGKTIHVDSGNEEYDEVGFMQSHVILSRI